MSISSIGQYQNSYSTTPPAGTHSATRDVSNSDSNPAETSTTASTNTGRSSKIQNYTNGGKDWGWSPGGVNTEIKVNGEVIGLILNSGAAIIDSKYHDLVMDLPWGDGEDTSLEGPDLAQKRVGDILTALKEDNRRLYPELEGAVIESVQASTAMTMAEWRQWLASPDAETGGHFDQSV